MEADKTFAVIGGDVRTHERYPDDVVVRRYASVRYGGNGPRKAAIQAIRSGGVDAVVLLTRWLGHSSFNAIRAACHRAGIPCVPVSGGTCSAARAVAALAGEG